ncbi:MAG: VTT domain-containing protein [Bacillota bacterium]|nr:VTT domain-containing protein [Bacillota bacterium]
MQFLTAFMNDYGYIILIVALTLGILAVPVPIEALMGYAGFLSFKGQLNWFGCILSATVGCIVGALIAYWIGYKLGMPFFEKYGQKIHLGPERINKTSQWFKKYGNKLLIVVFFIPGVRHLTGYFSGITRLSLKVFILYSSAGSLLWVSTFVILGKMLGPNWKVFQESIKKYLVMGSVLAIILLLVIFLIKKYQNKIIQFGIRTFKITLEVFKSRRKAELFLGAIALVTLVFMILMIGMTQDYLGNEFNDFNKISKILATAIFKGKLHFLMIFFVNFGKDAVLISAILCTFIWILWKGNEKLLEVYFLFLTIAGGEVYEELLRNIFHRLSPTEVPLLERFPYGFPSEQSLMEFVIYGFFFFIIIRHSHRIFVQTIATIFWIVILLFIGISRIYFAVQDPNQIAAGYVFGGVWLGLCVLLLEIFRMLTNMDVSIKKKKVSN